MIKFIAVCVLVMGLTLQACDKGCLKCNTKNECIFCDTSNNYYLSGTNCALSTLTNCLFLNLNGECGQCGANYYLDASTKKCVAVETAKQIANCSWYGVGQVCIKCAKNFYIKDAKCAAVVKLVDNCETYSDDGKCIGCAAGFIFNALRDGCVAIPNTAGCSAYSFIDCKTCATGFVPNQNLYFLDYVTNSSSIYAEVRRFIAGTSNDWTALFRCQKFLDPNCLTASAFNVCTICKPKFFLTADKQCRAYPKDIIEACLTYNSLLTCSSCQSGYYLENSKKCTLIAGDKLITDCVSYDNKASTVQCILCSTTKFLSANTCSSLRVDSLNIVNCKTVQIAADSCKGCNDGFTLTTDGKKCLASISNCTEYNTSSTATTVHTCKTCAPAYYLNTVDAITTCVSGGIEGCLTYSSSTVCTSCNTVEYFLKDAKCTKHVKIDNCLTYNGSNFNECVGCSVGFYPFKYTTICSAISVITNCKLYSDATTCLTCEDTYFILANKCVSISGTYPNCYSATKDSANCVACNANYALKVNGDKTCASNHKYILDYCDSTAALGTVINFPKSNAKETSTCSVCKENTFPFNLGTFFSCVSDDLLTTRGVTVTGCAKYSNADPPICLQCISPKFLRIATPRTCPDTCSSTNDTNLLDDLAGSFNTCDVTPGGTALFFLANCAVAIQTLLTAADAAAVTTRCIKPSGVLKPFITIAGAVADNPTIWKDVQGTSVILPDGAFLYNGFENSIQAAETLTHTPDENCEIYYKSITLFCARCKLGFTAKLATGGASTSCVQISECDLTKIYTGFSSSLNRFLSCHKCSGGKYVVVQLSIVTADDADTKFLITTLRANTNTISCQTIPDAETSPLPAKVANCLVYGWNFDATTSAMATGNKGCLACEPGYTLTTGKIWGTTCTLVPECDLTATQVIVNGCTNCKQDTTSRALKDYKAQECKSVHTANCLFSDGTVVDAKENCLVCKSGYWFNHDKRCEKITLPNCSDSTGVNFFTLDNTKVASVVHYYALKNLSKSATVSGCNTCGSNFTGYKLPADDIQCTPSPFVQENIFGATSNYITDCAKYKKELVAGPPKASCSSCKNNKIPTTDGKKCVTTISKCINAQNDPNTSKCDKCETTHVQISGSCVIKNIANCKDYEEVAPTELLCKTCNDGFVLATNKKSCYAGKVTGCKSYDLDLPWFCNACLSGYNRVTTTNSITPNTRTYCFRINDGSNCSALDETTNGLQGAFYKCTGCNSNNSAAFFPKSYDTADTVKVQSLCLALNLVDKCLTYNTASATVGTNSYLCTSCSTGFWINEETNVCVARVNQPSACVEYETNKDKCKKCSDSTFINETATDCISFPNGILRCATYSNDTVCTSCQPPAYLNANACPLSTAISKCLAYSANFTCTGCESGYFLTNSTFCELAKATNCLTYTSLNACEKCSPLETNKGLKTDTNGITSCVDKNVANCDLSTNEFPFKCTQCKKGFYLAADGNCAAATSINKCLIYDTVSTCTLCEPLSILAADRKSCDDTKHVAFNDINCVDSLLLGTPQCSKCNPGSIFVSNVCTACSNNTYADGCFSCDPANQATCFACRPGFYQNQNGKCVSITGVVTNGTVTTSASIVKLFGLLALFLVFLL